MKKSTAIKVTTFIALLMATFALTSPPAIGQTMKLQGVIDGRSGATMSLQIVGSPDAKVPPHRHHRSRRDRRGLPRSHQADAHDRTHSRPAR